MDSSGGEVLPKDPALLWTHQDKPIKKHRQDVSVYSEAITRQDAELRKKTRKRVEKIYNSGNRVVISEMESNLNALSNRVDAERLMAGDQGFSEIIHAIAGLTTRLEALEKSFREKEYKKAEAGDAGAGTAKTGAGAIE